MENSYVLITGATSGIGKATAIEFAKNQWNLILCGRRTERLQLIENDLKSNYSIEIISIELDVRDNNDVKNKLSEIPENIKKYIKILVNNAGLAAGRSPIHLCEDEDWEQMIDTNIKGLLYVSKNIIPLFIKNKCGHIINISSIAGKENYPDGNVYCATKHAVDSLSQSMRIDLLPHQIKVTNIAPGAVRTEFADVRFKGDMEKIEATYRGYEPLKPEDIAETIYFVATRPSNVNINDITIMPTQQANSTQFFKVEP